MQQSESITELALALSKAQAEMPPILMDSRNPYYDSKYASLGAVIQGSAPILTKFGLSISQFPVSELNTIGVTSVLMHSSGQWIRETVTIPFPDDSKKPAQEAGIFISYLRRYGWSAIAGLCTEEDTDGEHAPKAGKPAPEKWDSSVIADALTRMDGFKMEKFKNSFELEGALKYSKELIPGITGPGMVAFWGQHYKEARTTDNLQPEQAAEKADSEFVAEKARRAQDKAVV
jgi:hypothetical protein